MTNLYGDITERFRGKCYKKIGSISEIVQIEEFISASCNQKNIFIGMHMLKDWYEYWSETKGKPESYSWKLSLACYNAGIIKVMKYGGIPPYRETINYINFILKPSILNNNVNSNNFLATK